MLKLKNLGMSSEDIANEVNLRNNCSDVTPELIDPIIRFLLNHEADDVLKSYQNYLKGVKIKFCEVCGEEFIEPKKVNGQTICKVCKKKYKPTEILVLKGIKEGKYDQNTAINAYLLRKKGLNNKEIAKKLKIPSNLVTAIIDILLPEEFGEKNKNGSDNSKNSKPKSICKYCGKEFSPKNSSSGDLFCSNCNKKYNYSDLLLFIGIKEGKYSFKLATEIYKLQRNGVSDEDISEKFHIPKDLINKILYHYGFNGENVHFSSSLNNCAVCGNLFVMVKSTSNQQYCPDCKGEFKNNQLRVLAGINKGIYNKKLATKIKNRLDNGDSKAAIAKKFKISTSIIDHIIEYLYDEEMPDFMNNSSINSKLSDNLLITNCSDNQINFRLKGIISNEFAINFINIFSKINLTIKELIFKEKEDNIEFSVNFDVENIYLDKLFSELINIGFE